MKETFGLIIRRLTAFTVDMALNFGYGAAISYAYYLTLPEGIAVTSLYDLTRGQLWLRLALLFPVFLYFWLTERGKSHGTLGKRLLGIQVVDDRSSKFSYLLRNGIKLSPLFATHITEHLTVSFTRQHLDIPSWVSTVEISCTVVALLFVISLFIRSGQGSIYDLVAGTRVTKRK